MEKAKMAVVSFTPRGKVLAQKIADCLVEPLAGTSWVASVVHQPRELKAWCQECFRTTKALVFIGATGIAVRTIAPCLTDKTKDPAVIVVDEKGHHMISLLSGHLGGGNALTTALAKKIRAVPVITTASDVNDKIAIDVFAKKNRLQIASMEQAKKAAAAIVAKKVVEFSCSGRILGQIPPELREQGVPQYQIEVTPYTDHHDRSDTLTLIPKAFLMGLGCRRGISGEAIESQVLEELEKHRISIFSIEAVATIDLKREEQGLLDFCQKYRLPITFYSSGQLWQAPGEYPASAFVLSVTGVDNVCERAAVLKALEMDKEAGQHRIIVPKSKKEGVTVALAKIDWSVEFE